MTPRAKFVAESDIKKIAARCWDAMHQASNHDPDHARVINLLAGHIRKIECRLAVIERQRLGAPRYCKVR